MHTKTVQPQLQKLLDQTADFYRISVERLTGPTRSKGSTEYVARSVGMYLAHRCSGHTYREIAFAFERSDRDVAQASKWVAEQLKTSALMEIAVDSIAKRTGWRNPR